jgi:hypothetical protein
MENLSPEGLINRRFYPVILSGLPKHIENFATLPNTINAILCVKRSQPPIEMLLLIG